MKRGYDDSCGQPQSKRRLNSHGESGNTEDESTESAHRVAAHYSARSNQTLEEREASPIIHLKKLNNWIKSVLIQLYARRGDAVLDFACGKVKDCRTRYNGDVDQQQRRKKFSFPARLICADCFEARLDQYLHDDGPYDICSCQFALHYSWSTEARARRALASISALLRPGGTFIGTMPDANVIIKRLREGIHLLPRFYTCKWSRFFCSSCFRLLGVFVDENNEFFYNSWPSCLHSLGGRSLSYSTIGIFIIFAEGLSFGNSVYWISFDEDYAQKKFKASSPFGIQYTFHLEDAVDCPEWIVPFHLFKSLAEEYDLELVFVKNSHEFVEEYLKKPEFSELMRRLGALGDDKQDQSTLSQDEWDVAYLYLSFVLRKRGQPNSFQKKSNTNKGKMFVSEEDIEFIANV